MLFKRMILPACMALGLAALGRPASADLDFHVLFDTSALNPASTYYTEFTLSDGQEQSSGTPGSNSAVFSNFNFGTGASGAVSPPIIGNASGSTASSVTLADGDPGGLADFAQAFTPGSTLSFDVDATTFANTGGTPDILTFYLLDSSFTNLPTNAPALTPNAFLRLDITGSTVTIASVGAFGGSPVAAPDVSDIVAATPEPGTMALGIGVSFCGSLIALRRRRATRR